MTNTAIDKRQPAQTPEVVTERRTVLPRTDIVETNKSFVLVADMPGVPTAGVSIHLNGDELTVEGKAQVSELQGFHASHTEYEVVDYRRAFRLSSDVERTGIEAEVKNGVLRLTLPKAAEAKPRKIKVHNG
jgi:HSP20 family molecular chaperone IbpA